MELVDTHAHLDLLEGELQGHLQQAREAGLVQVAAVGIDLASSRKAVDYARSHEMVKAVVGVHPHDSSMVNPEVMRELRVLAGDGEVVGVGETGLDFYRNLSPRAEQERSFRRHLELARELAKPVVIHDREAHARTLRILEEFAPFEDGLIMHCFSGDAGMARDCMDMGGYISIAGPVTFSSALTLREVVAELPLDRLILETDSPFLSPHPFRGKPNTPARVALTAQAVAALKGVTPEEVAAATTTNWYQLTRQHHTR